MATLEFEVDIVAPLICGVGSVGLIGEAASQFGARRVLLVSDPGVQAAGHVDAVLQGLSQAGIESFVFSEVQENPTDLDVEKGRRYAASLQIDLIIGLGGGSAMDCAKGINFLLTNGGRMQDYWGMGKAGVPMLPSIGIPTTTGTGSEAQSYCLISDCNTHVKMACGDPQARFRKVILDPELTLTMPQSVAAVGAMDAVAHALESFVCAKRNPVSNAFAQQAWKLLDAHFEKGVESPCLGARASLQLGAYMAGLAIEASMLGAAHACANPLTARIGLTHGKAVGLMLPHVLVFNSEAAGDCYQQLTGAPRPMAAVDHLLSRISKFQEVGKLPRTLQQCGIGEEDLVLLADQASQQWTGKFNPRRFDSAASLTLYQEAFQ